MVIMLLDFLNMCVSVCTSDCANYPQMRSRLPSQVPELPSNITHGLCFDPLASHSPQPPLKPSAYCTVCVCGATGMHAQWPLKPFVLQIYTVLPLFPMPISPFSFINVSCAGLITGEQGLALFPAHSAFRSLRGILLLLLLHSPRLFFKVWETVALALVPVNPLWESSAGFFSGSEKVELNDACFSAQENHTRIGHYHHDRVQCATPQCIFAFTVSHHVFSGKCIIFFAFSSFYWTETAEE